MADTKIMQVSGVARPSRRLRMMAKVLHGNKMSEAIDSMMVDATMINALAGMIDRALIKGTSKDGRIDLKDTAMHLIQEMRNNQR